MTSLRNPDYPPCQPPGRDELAAWLRLTLANGVGAATALSLLRAFGTPDKILGTTYHALSQVVGAAIATRLVQPEPEVQDRVNMSLDWAERPDQHLVTLPEQRYPRALLDIPDPPPLLFIRGNLACLNQPMLAIVGSRHASRGGLDNARAFSRELAGRGICVVSGLALGIDAAAHEGAIDAEGFTVGVLGTGLNNIYPQRNRPLAKQVCLNGALISEFDLDSAPRRGHFPRRNRLIAGLCSGVLVVEAASQSGSLITARLAGEFGREVFAIPGSIHSPHAKGCHQLIRDGAQLVESVEDLLSECQPEFLANATQNLKAGSPVERSVRVVKQPETTLSADDQTILETIGWEPVSYDLLSSITPVYSSSLDEALLRLELGGWLDRLPDGRVVRLSGQA